MKAAQIKEYGSVENIEVVDIDVPVPDAGQVQVEVYAASLNPFDTSVREGHARQMAELTMPATLGGDIAGVVSALGEGVTAFKVGDKVYGSSQALAGNSGALAEYSVTGADSLAIAPLNVTMAEAAALPLVGVSALQAISEHLELASGKKLFIQGGSGGIGTVAIQIAKNLGAYVAASTKGAQVDYVKGFGADEVVNVDSQDYSTVLKDYDAELVLVRGEDWDKLLTVLKPGGVAVSLVGPADEALTSAHNVTVYAQGTNTNTTWLDQLRGLVEGGVVTPQVAHTYTLDQVQEAFATREGGGVSGKVVVQIKQ
jgi:NADPH:quinone reductase-like Zn-dependent oxidoreductase